MENLIREETRRFAITSSMKGLPRVAKAQTCGCRTGWCLVVLAFLALSVYQTTILCLNFCNFETYTQVFEVPINPLKLQEQAVVPDISICNLNPVTSDPTRYRGIPTFREYQNMMMDFVTCANCSKEMVDKMQRIRSDVMSLLGYTQFIGRENSKRIGHNISEFVVFCGGYVIDGLKRKIIPCNSFVHTQQFLFHDNFNCLNMHINPGRIKAMTGIKFILYLDNFDEDLDHAFEAADDAGQTSGALYYVHTQKTVPCREKGQMIRPGVFSSVQMSLQHRKRLGPPYGRCANEYPGGKVIHIREDNAFVLRTDYICRCECLTEYILSECKCFDLRQTVLNMNESYPTCGDANAGREVLAERMLCAEKARSEKIAECIDICSIPCEETIYNSELEQAIWPRRSHLKSFYNHYISDKPYRNKFRILQNISQGNSSKEDLLEAERLVRENFLQMAFDVKDFSYILYKDSPKSNFANLMSQIGGTLNLWSGITVFLVVEILEFIYRLCTNCNDSETGVTAGVDEIKVREAVPT